MGRENRRAGRDGWAPRRLRGEGDPEYGSTVEFQFHFTGQTHENPPNTASARIPSDNFINENESNHVVTFAPCLINRNSFKYFMIIIIAIFTG